MKKILICSITFLSFLIGCNGDTFKERMCQQLLDQRERLIYHNEVQAINQVDSMLIRCGCDTLK